MQLFKRVLAVGFGGAGGAWLRYSVLSLSTASFFPFGTLFINIVGCFLLGMINGLFSTRKNSYLFTALGSGFCGGFTTMSAFSQEFTMLMHDSTVQAAIYLGSTLILGMLGGFFGLYMFGVRRGGSI